MSASVLIAEDDPLIASFIERGLRASGYETHVARDGLEAERLSGTDKFDLMVLDMALPGRSGFQVLQRLRAAGSTLPVVVLTGRPELKDAVGGLGVPPEDYMTKPFHFPQLLARVGAHTGGSGTARSGSTNPPSGRPSAVPDGQV